MPSPLQEWLTFIVGIIVLIVSIVVIVLCQLFTKEIFNLPDVEKSGSTEADTAGSEIDAK